MSDLGFVEAFAKFDAAPKNSMWAVSSIAKDGALVLSCWAHYLTPGGKGVLLYNDRLSRWNGNGLGCGLLRTHLEQAVAGNLPVRLIVATTSEIESVNNGQDLSRVKKTFHVREDIVGKVMSFDGDTYVIEFRRRP